MTTLVSVDVGGTFTDAVVVHRGRLTKGKARTTSQDLSIGFAGAISDAAEGAGLSFEEIVAAADFVKYSTTVGINALIERAGPRVGLITTAGQEETLHVGRSRNWGDGMSHDVQMDRTRARRPDDLVPRALRVGVRERIDCFGNVIMPLSREDLADRVNYLVNAGVQAIAVCLTWSFTNPSHEQLVREVVEELYPQTYLGRVPVLLSSDVAPKLDEYRRSVTTVLSAFLALQTEEHLLDIADRLARDGYSRPLLLARNVGGVSSPSRTTALHLVGAGAVAGLSGAAAIAREQGAPNVITADMGGTTFDVGLIIDSHERTYEFDPVVDRWRIHLPVIANFSIGAGGGSIAWLTPEQELRVGPQSAGSVPGPACYESGGTEPTVTDADLELGYIDPDHFLGGRFKLSRSKAERAIRRRIADPLGIGIEDAAQRIRRLADGIMGQEIYKQTALKGQDPRTFVMFAFGGAGPVHACEIAGYADVVEINTFSFGSEFNAFGAACMDVMQTYERTYRLSLYDAVEDEWLTDTRRFNAVVDDLLVFAERDLSEEGFTREEVEFSLELDMNYGGQQHTVRQACDRIHMNSPEELRELADAFNTTFANVYGEGATHPEGGIEIQLFKLTATAALGEPPTRLVERAQEGNPLKGERMCRWADEFVPTPVYERSAVRPGFEVAGPALIEDIDTVVAVAPGWRFVMDARLTGRLHRKDAE
jgi:N-methylhydantoinase A/acetophenone carboxylase